MTLIAAGQSARRRMNQSLQAVADIEQKENALRKQFDMAERQQEASMLSTGAGLGASYGLKAMAGAKGAAGSVATPAVNLGRVAAIGQGAGGSGLASTAPNALAGVTEAGKIVTGVQEGASLVNLGNVAAAGGEAAGVTGAVLESAAAGATAGAGAGAGAGAAGAGAAGAGAGAAGAGAGAASGGVMASLSALAAPVAIGLGVAALLNKLFD